MTLDKARELIATQLRFGGGYNRNAVPLILGEVQREHGPRAMDGLIRELNGYTQRHPDWVTTSKRRFEWLLNSYSP